MNVMNSLWLEQCRDGDLQAIERLVSTYQHDVYRLALSIIDNPCEAAEATQDVFIRTLRSIDSYQGNASFKTWLFSITINVSRSRLKRIKNRDKLQMILQNLFYINKEQEHPEKQVIHDESDSELWRAVNCLDDKHRIPIVLRYYHNLPITEIADILGKPVGTVHSRLNYARRQLRSLLKEEQE
jgi:RNA polymerase sigma-70 factor (ECF subfamily)